MQTRLQSVQCEELIQNLIPGATSADYPGVAFQVSNRCVLLICWLYAWNRAHTDILYLFKTDIN